MNYSQGHSRVSSITKCCFILIVLFISSCSNQHQAISITDKPVFSENDTFVTSLGNIVITRYDYFLVKGSLRDKKKLKKILNDFGDNYSRKEKIHFDDYIMFFYENSDEVNEALIKNTEEKYRYKIFVNNKEDNCIASVNYRDSITIFWNWDSKYLGEPGN
jgi:hypothetical protein